MDFFSWIENENSDWEYLKQKSSFDSFETGEINKVATFPMAFFKVYWRTRSADKLCCVDNLEMFEVFWNFGEILVKCDVIADGY